jgi:hypothetical protein
MELEVAAQSRFQFWDGRILHEVDVFVLDRAPAALDEDIVQSTSSAVLADSGANSFRFAGEFLNCKLRSLVGVEDRLGSFGRLQGDFSFSTFALSYPINPRLSIAGYAALRQDLRPIHVPHHHPALPHL